MKRQVKVSVGRSVGYSVGESAGEGAASAPGTDLLDLYTGAVVAYSTARRLRTAYTGPLFRVRRSSDNAEQDVGFDPVTGVVDESALTTFVGANDGLVVTIYNQTGGGFDATIGTASLQPSIVVAGVVQTLGTNNRPAPLWDNTDDRLSAAGVSLPGPQLALWWACRDASHADYNAVVHYGTAAVSTGEFAIYSPDTDFGTDVVHFYNNSAIGTTHATAAAPLSYVGRVRGNLTSGSTLENPRINGGAETVGTAASGTGYGTAKNLHIGNRSDGVAAYSGIIGEMLVYNSLTPATTDGIDTDMMTFWGIV